MLKVGILGANGYTGMELMRLLSAHRHAKVVFAASRSYEGKIVGSLYPSLIPFYSDLKFDAFDLDKCADMCDLVFTALPHAAAAECAAYLVSKGIKVIDLSADFRYDDISLYEKTYSVQHPAGELNSKAVYGLCELYRDEIKSATLVANPGCYTTASILPLYPLLSEKLIDPKNIIIDAKSGTSGAGRKDDADYGFCEVDGNFKAYAVTNHRHTSEIEEKLSKAGEKISLSFTPHLLPVKRGILATIYASSTASEAQIRSAYEKFYGTEKFVTVLPQGALPEIKFAAGSNNCFIGFKSDPRLGKLIIVSCIDNLIKGASGQAIQNMNIICGFDEDEALPRTAFHL